MKVIPGRERVKEKKAEAAAENAPKKLKMSIVDRLLIGQIFPEKGNYMMNVLMEDIASKVRIGQAETKELGLHAVPGPDGSTRTEWKNGKDKTFEFTGAEMSFLKSRIDHLDRTEAITPNIMPLARKIKEA
jgi:hypothetical protein